MFLLLEISGIVCRAGWGAHSKGLRQQDRRSGGLPRLIELRWLCCLGQGHTRMNLDLHRSIATTRKGPGSM